MEPSGNIIERYKFPYEMVLFHCCSKYPAVINEVYLKKIETYIENYECDIGYSDHTVNEGVIYRAVALGANYIEMHFDLDDMEGWESNVGHCWCAKYARRVIRNVRNGETAEQYSNTDTCFRDDKSDPEDGLRPMKCKRKIAFDSVFP